MDDYNWQDHESRELGKRFPLLTWLYGGDAWSQGVMALVQGNKPALNRWLDNISIHRRRVNQFKCPRVFISHRQSDVLEARRVAFEASRAGFDFWLDVIDLPKAKTSQVLRLEKQLHRTLTPFEIALIQAAIIEVALVNCTHVIAVITPNTAGSLWVPYEYGRIDRNTSTIEPAACWCDASRILVRDLPEYLLLAPVHWCAADIGHWLRTELLMFPQCCNRGIDSWPYDEIPPALPGEPHT